MKTPIKSTVSFIILFVLITSAQVLKGQDFLCDMRNDIRVDDHTYEFDIYLQATGSTPMLLAAVQFGIYINSSVIPDGGVLSATLVPGSSQLLKSQKPKSSNFSVENSVPNKTIKITGINLPGIDKATKISNNAPGTRFCRVRISCTKPFVPDANFGLTWSFNPPPSWPSKLIAFVSGTPVNITKKGSYKSLLTIP
jgi:hypothetical protein